MDGITCLVTIHGIGFQHAPENGSQGYADGLHDSLDKRIPKLLSGDPRAEFGRPAGPGQSTCTAIGLPAVERWKRDSSDWGGGRKVMPITG